MEENKMKDTNKSTNVLVTGGTGFLASWTIRKLLEKAIP
jgi:nucleoside-diphosphate-sugar epimerase